MARFVLRGSMLTGLAGSISKNILIGATCLLSTAWIQSPALAQHPGVHAGGGGHVGGGVRMSTPPQAAISRPRAVGGPHAAGFGPRGFGFRQGPIRVFRRRQFFGAPFFRFGVGWRFNAGWRGSCGPYSGWGWGFDCYPLAFSGGGFENYVTLPTYESPVYVYGGEGHDLIWLYLKDGTAYGVTDYWFVNGEVHFSMLEEGATKLAEHVIALDELDLQKTIDVNTRRGFRIVLRDEPWQQYLKDHPDLTPPELAPPQKN
jgi:hypothetical protein